MQVVTVAIYLKSLQRVNIMNGIHFFHNGLCSINVKTLWRRQVVIISNPVTKAIHKGSPFFVTGTPVHPLRIIINYDGTSCYEYIIMALWTELWTIIHGYQRPRWIDTFSMKSSWWKSCITKLLRVLSHGATALYCFKRCIYDSNLGTCEVLSPPCDPCKAILI